MLSPIFAFARELVNGRIEGIVNYKVPGSINFDHELRSDEFRVGDPAFDAFKQFVATDPQFKVLVSTVDRNRSFIELQLRFNIVTAAYGRVMGERVFISTDDQQVTKAVDTLPRARDLAMSATKQLARP